jgi:very-short-patch-repair endonuclease
MPKGVYKRSDEYKKVLGNRLAIVQVLSRRNKIPGYVPWNKDKKGVQVPWNKNLTKADPRIEKYASQTRGVPKSESHRQKIRDARARQKPTKISKEEKALVKALTEIGIPNKPQFVVSKKEIRFLTFVDIMIPNVKLAIYVDGVHWHSLPGYPERDARVNDVLPKDGYMVLRFSDVEVDENIESVVRKILVAIIIRLIESVTK